MPCYFSSLGRLSWGLAAAAAAACVCTIGSSSSTIDFLRRHHTSVPLFDGSAVVRVEKHACYPCAAFDGFSVVVSNYYVRTAADHGAVQEDGDASRGGSGRLARFLAMFSNETHTVAGDANPVADENQLHLVREVVGDSRAPPTLPTDSSPPFIDDTTVAAPSVPFVASSMWPKGTAKYAAVTIEPTNVSSSDLLAALRQLADSATHQSLIRCDPFAPPSMNCAGDASYLGAPYLRVMLNAFVLLPSPLPRLRVAVLGVGGGSLPSFLQQYFSRDMVRLDLVDAEPQCFRAAVEDLGMRGTMHGGEVTYHVCDGLAFLQDVVASSGGDDGEASHGGTPVFFPGGDADAASARVCDLGQLGRHASRYDVLFVDLFLGSEPPAFMSSVPFLRLCHGALSSVGVAAFNLPATDPVFVDVCRRVFGAHNVFQLPVPASANIVVLARRVGEGDVSSNNGGAVHVSRRHFYRRARLLQESHMLPYDLAAHYPAWWRLW